ncbi:MAG TPA: helix-turn-helix domain-containing protein [Candidatus Eisenbacteria bacterium]
MGRRITTALLSRPAQAKALSQPIRLEIVEAFRPGEELGVDELAARLGRKPVSLYFHVRNLVANDILVAADERRGAGRPTRLYRVAADRLMVSPSPKASRDIQAGFDLFRATLRATERDFRKALALYARPGSVQPTRMAGQRMKGRLSDRELKIVEGLLTRLENIFINATGRRSGRLVAVTTVMVPIG